MNNFNKILISFVFLLFIGCDIFNSDSEEFDYSDDYPHPVPDKIRVVSISDNVLKIEWTPLSSEYSTSSFQIERSLNDLDFNVLLTEIRYNFFYDYSLHPDSQYTYRIKAYNNEKESNYKYFKIKFDSLNVLKTRIEFPFSSELRLSKGGKYLGAISNNLIKIWDAETWDEVLSLSENCGNISDFQFSGDQEKIAYAADTTIKIKQITTSTPLSEIHVNNKIRKIALDSNFTKVAVSTYWRDGFTQTSNISMYSMDNLKIWEQSDVGTVYGLLNRNKYKQLICCLYGRIWIIRTNDGALLKEIQTDGNAFRSPFLNTGNDLLITINTPNVTDIIYVLNLNNFNTSEINLNRGVLNVRVNEELDTYIYSDDNFIRFLKNNANKPFYSFSVSLDRIKKMEYSNSNGDIICTVPYEGIYVYSEEKINQWQVY